MTSLVEKYQELEQFLATGRKYRLLSYEIEHLTDDMLSDL